ncbi:PaaI family thioesterase [Sphingomonas sp. SUN039]|uniref:PaaI family thioesterase n=1 Tax=Sphingomonas sp. SUN039 TaxID=2937787 RepID=UPI00216492CC|nr:PaaI family thioesterase [Sphingomonas sp. SUN039]UVO54548.1 PaaI family thioesterase [Sphingomonas sp. SUN039]
MTPDFDPAMLIAMMTGRNHNGLLGTQYSAHGDDWCELCLPYRDDLVGDAASGIIASGPIITMMDSATSISVWLATKKFRPQATLDLRVDYLRPAGPGKTVYGRGECYKVTKSIAFVRGEAHDGDPARPLAHVAGTYMFTDG